VEDDAGGIDGLAHARLDGLTKQFARLTQYDAVEFLHERAGIFVEQASSLFLYDVRDRLEACPTVIKDLLSQPGEGAAQTLGHQGQGLLPEPAGDGFALQQFGNGGEIPE
jgi:hypothetical protein